MLWRQYDYIREFIADVKLSWKEDCGYGFNTPKGLMTIPELATNLQDKVVQYGTLFEGNCSAPLALSKKSFVQNGEFFLPSANHF